MNATEARFDPNEAPDADRPPAPESTARAPAPPRARGRRLPSIPGWTSPLGLALRGCVVALPFLVLHAIGAREATSILSGTPPDDGPIGAGDAWMGGAYVLAWFVAILAGPILALAGGLLAIWDRVSPAGREVEAGWRSGSRG